MSQIDGYYCNIFEYGNSTADDAIPGDQSRQKNECISLNTSKHKTAVLQRNTRGTAYLNFLHAKPWIPGGEKSIFTVVIH